MVKINIPNFESFVLEIKNNSFLKTAKKYRKYAIFQSESEKMMELAQELCLCNNQFLEQLDSIIQFDSITYEKLLMILKNKLQVIEN